MCRECGAFVSKFPADLMTTCPLFSDRLDKFKLKPVGSYEQSKKYSVGTILSSLLFEVKSIF